MAVIPGFIIILSFIIWGGYAIHKRDSGYLSTHGVATIVILIFLVHPQLIKLMFSIFSCREIEGDLYLNENLEIQCWDEKHTLYAICVALPSIIIWGVGTPAAILVALVKNRKYLKAIPIRIRFGFLFNGYFENTYYWEFTILYRKILIICCSVFLNSVSTEIQALCVLIILLVSLQIQNKIRPFISPELNVMESRSIFVATISIYCGLFYLTKDLDDATKIILFLVMVFVNLYFLLYWCTKMFQAGLIMIKKKLPCFKHQAVAQEIDVKFTSANDNSAINVTLLGEDASVSPKKAKKLEQKTLGFKSMKDYYWFQLDPSLFNESPTLSKKSRRRGKQTRLSSIDDSETYPELAVNNVPNTPKD